MRAWQRIVATVGLSVLLVVASGVNRLACADAGNGTPTGEKMFAKLGRGLANAVTGWIEIPRQMRDESEVSGLGVGLTWGLAEGVGYAIARTIAGVYEIVSFPVPMPEDYRPVIDPLLLFSAEETRAATPR